MLLGCSTGLQRGCSLSKEGKRKVGNFPAYLTKMCLLKRCFHSCKPKTRQKTQSTMLVINCFKMWANNGLINIPNVDRPALCDVRWQMDGGPSVPQGLQLSGPALNLRCFCFRSLVKWCDSDTNGVRIALDLSADLSFLHYDAGNWFLVNAHWCLYNPVFLFWSDAFCLWVSLYTVPQLTFYNYSKDLLW